MRQELIDLLLNELDPVEADALKARLDREPELARELGELEALFGLMRRGEEIETPAAMRALVLAEAERRCAPSLLQRLRQLPGLIRYRFQQSVAFRVAAISLCAHLVLMAVLFNVVLKRPAPAGEEPEIGVVATDEPQEPDRAFRGGLMLRRLPHDTRLKQFGVLGQAQAIERGLEKVLARQTADGAFGDPAETAWSTLALLAEGDCSTEQTQRGLAIRRAVGYLLGRVEQGAAHGAILSALVEDYALSYDQLRDEERLEYVRAIRRLILAAGSDEASREGLALASLAGFPIPAGRELQDASYLLVRRGWTPFLKQAPDRIGVTAVLARGQLVTDSERVRKWAEPLFAAAMADLSAGKAEGLVLLTLQAPYRL